MSKPYTGPKLPTFNYNAWMFGTDDPELAKEYGSEPLKFDLWGKSWGGRGWYKVKGKPGLQHDKDTIIIGGVRRKRRVKVRETIKPSIPVLTENCDGDGRSPEDHMAMIEHYAHLYASGKDRDGNPLNSQALKEKERVNKRYAPEPIRKRNKRKNSKNDGIALLTQAFKAWAEVNKDEDEDEDE